MDLTAENEAALRVRVERGAQLLDEKMPEWWSAINVETLDLHDEYECVLGQIGMCVLNRKTYLDVACALSGVNDSTVWEMEYGFNFPYARAYEPRYETFNGTDVDMSRYGRAAWLRLEELWLTQIEKRRAEAGQMA